MSLVVRFVDCDKIILGRNFLILFNAIVVQMGIL